MTIFSTNLGGGMAPLALPWLRLCFGPPLGNFPRTPRLATIMQHSQNGAVWPTAQAIRNVRRRLVTLLRDY